jgi:[ribosomal protein S18]-alanine N-acetyltransferase
VIRAANVADAPELAIVHAEAFAEPWSAEALAELVAAEGAVALTGEGGFILARAAAGEAEILTLAVRPAERRRGVARALVEAAAAAARAAGAESLFLEVAADNAAALALYRRCGFEQIGLRARYYRRVGAPPMDALVLRRTLKRANA